MSDKPDSDEMPIDPPNPQPVRDEELEEREEVERIIPANPGFEQLVYTLDGTVLRYPIIAWQQREYLWRPVTPGTQDYDRMSALMCTFGLQHPDGKVQDEDTGILFDNVHDWVKHVRKALKRHEAAEAA
jgi:hypothetical protein